jgi:hypothetical protein
MLWEMPADVWKLIQAMPEEERTHISRLVAGLLELTARNICTELQFSSRTGRPHMREMLNLMSKVRDMQRNRIGEAALQDLKVYDVH